MNIILGAITFIVGLFICRWWAIINNWRRPYEIPLILKNNNKLVLFGYLFWFTIIIYGLVILFKVNVIFPVIFISVALFLRIIEDKNNSLNSQIEHIFKIYLQEKKEENNLKKETWLLQVTAKKYLLAKKRSRNYYYFDKDFFDTNCPKDIKDLAFQLIARVQDIWVDPENNIEVSKFWKTAKERIDLLYNKYF